MKFSKKVLIFPAILLLIGLVITLAVPGTSSAGNMIGVCSNIGTTHKVDIIYNHASPQNTDALLCDKIEFTNKDAIVREISFGQHDEHTAYDGIFSKVIRPNQSFTITLVSPGLYHFHDHLHDEVSGYFSVDK